MDAPPESQPPPKTYQTHVQPKGGKPLWVLNGRLYNYRKEGATPVPNQAAADEVIAAQKAEKDAIQGLGPGGNKDRGMLLKSQRACMLENHHWSLLSNYITRKGSAQH